MMNRRVSMAFDTWHDHAREQRRMAYICNRIVKRMLNANLEASFQTWHYDAAKQKGMRAKARLVLSRMVDSRLSRAWQTWKTFPAWFLRLRGIGQVCSLSYSCPAGDVSKYNIVLENCQRFRSRLAVKAFMTWSSNAAILSKQSLAMLRFVDKWTRSALVQCFTTWLRQHRNFTRQRRIIKASCAKWYVGK